MKLNPMRLAAALLGLINSTGLFAQSGQVPGRASAPGIAISDRDRVYLSDQTSNTVSVVNPQTNMLLGLIKLGEPTPANLSPLYTGQLLVHGMGLSPDHRTLVVVSVGSNSAAFIETATNRVKHVVYLGRSPHEAMFTPTGREVWITVRGENYVQVLDGQTYAPKLRITVPNGPGMTIFSPDGKYGYICSSFSSETVVVDVRTHHIVGRVPQASSFCPDIAATPDGAQVWLTLKDIGKTEVFNARPPFNRIALLNTGAITNHVNIVRNASGQFAYVTVGGMNAVKVFTTTSDPQFVTTIPTGALPHGLWPSGDGTHIYVGLENANAVAVIDTKTNSVIATVNTGQSPQGMVYIPRAVPTGTGTDNLIPLGRAQEAAHLTLGARGATAVLTTVSINNQGLVDVLEAAVTGLEPKSMYVLALSEKADGSGPLEAIAQFAANPAGAAIVTAIGPLRKAVEQGTPAPRRYLVIATIQNGTIGGAVQIQQ
jgi:YVTN family beta-propeller protein